MHRTTPILLFLAFLCLQSEASPFFGGNSLKTNILMNARVTSSGMIDLQKDAYSASTFYALADLSNYNYSQYQSNNSSSPYNIVYVDTRKMMISIANRETLVAENCLNFSAYDCNKYRCDKYDLTTTFDFPTFTVNAQYAMNFIYLDYTYWSLTSDYSYIAQSCQTGDTSSNIGSNRYGVLGLGTTVGSQNSEIFSIFIDSYLNGGILLLKKDTTTFTQSSTPYYTLYANATWQLPTYSGYIQVEDSSVSLDGNIMFDINSDAIGLPSNIYNSFISYFGSISSVSCYSGYNYKPYCYTTKQLKGLPDITLSINSDSQIKIPSQIYATLSSDSGSVRYFNLNFKSTSPYLSGKNYVSPSFKNSIILDANFMSYYYTVFDATSGSNVISLYPSINAPAPPPDSAKWIGAGAVGTLLLVSIYCCCTKKKRSAMTTTTPLNITTFNTTTQAPLAYNQQGVNNLAPTYSYDATNYNNPGYSYPAQPQVYQPYPQPQGGMYDPGYVPPAPSQTLN